MPKAGSLSPGLRLRAEEFILRAYTAPDLERGRTQSNAVRRGRKRTFAIGDSGLNQEITMET